MNDITKSSNLLHFILFADDTNIFHSHKYINTLVETLNNELNKVSLWFKCNKLSLNVNKTCFLHFSNHNPKNIQRLHIFIDNLPIIEKKFYQILRSNTWLQLNMDRPLSQGNNICIKSHRYSLQIETYTYEENSCNAIQFTRATPHNIL